MSLKFWEMQPPTLESMYLRADARSIDPLEKEEILALLPPFKEVLDLGAGIGRFTREFAKKGAHVTAVDATPKFTEANRAYNRDAKNISYLTANATELNFSEQIFDLIFINGLLMYLEDVEVTVLVHRLTSWLKPGGTLFLRESCAATPKTRRDTYVAHYRPLSFYPRILDPLLTLQSSGSIQTHIDRYANPFQCYWIYVSTSFRS